MKKEQLDKIEGILHSFADNFQTHGGFCIQFNGDNMSDFREAANHLAEGIENVAFAITRLAEAVESLKTIDNYGND